MPVFSSSFIMYLFNSVIYLKCALGGQGKDKTIWQQSLHKNQVFFLNQKSLQRF